MIDVIFGLDGEELPEIVVSDTGSYSGPGLRPAGDLLPAALADLPDQKGWRWVWSSTTWLTSMLRNLSSPGRTRARVPKIQPGFGHRSCTPLPVPPGRLRPNGHEPFVAVVACRALAGRCWTRATGTRSCSARDL